MKPYKSKFTEAAPEIGIPLPDGFKKVYTGGNINAYEKNLSNGKIVEVYGANDDNPLTDEINVIYLFDSREDKDNNSYSAVAEFKNEAELKAILEKWEKSGTLFESVKPYKRLFTEIKIEGIRYLSELATALKDHIANSDSFDYKDYVQDVQLRGKYLVIIVKTAMEEKGAKKLEKHLKSEFKDIGKVFKSEVETAYGQIVIRYSYKEEKKEK